MKLIVYLGTGGVGKTSVAAATALKLAREGRKALVLAIDPALRLRTALRLKAGLLEQEVPLDPAASGELWAALLDVRATLDEAVRLYAKSDVVEPILAHPIYQTIADSLVGMQELMAIERIDQLHRRGFEHIVVDTAPSRHALEFLDKPQFFADLVGSNWVRLVGRTYKFVERSGVASLGRKTIDLYARVESILGTKLVKQVLDFYSIFVATAEGYADRAQRTVAMLKDPAVTEFRIVSTPQKALRDARFFSDALKARQFHAAGMYVNRVWPECPETGPVDGLAGELMDWYGAVRRSHLEAAAQLHTQFAGTFASIAAIPELQRDVDGLDALERIARDL